jgi:transcription elongation factor Elf1
LEKVLCFSCPKCDHEQIVRGIPVELNEAERLGMEELVGQPLYPGDVETNPTSVVCGACGARFRVEDE